MLISVFSLGMVVLLLATLVGALLWRRMYRDDPQNAARRIFKNSAATFSLRVLVRGLDMVFAFILYGGALTAAEIGRYDLAALLVVQYLGTFTDFGLGVLLTREVAREPAAAQRLFGVTLALRLLLVLVAAVPFAALMIGGYAALEWLGVGEALTPTGQAAIWILLLTLIPGAFSGAVTAIYNANERMEVPAVVELITAILSFFARILVLILGLGILGLAWAAVAVSVITALIFLGLQRRSFFRPTLAWDRTAMWALVPVAFPLMLNNLLSAIFFRFDAFVIRAFTGVQGDDLIGAYNMAYRILGIALVIPPAVTFAVFPLLARRAVNERAGLADAQRRTLQLLLIVALPLAMGISVLSYDLVQFFSRSEFVKYQTSIGVLAIMAWFLPLSFANGLLQYVLIAVNRQQAITKAFLIGAAFNLVMNMLLVPLLAISLGRPDWTLYAAALLTILSEVVLYLVFRPLLISEGLASNLLPMFVRPTLAALMMGAVMLVLRWPLPEWPGAVLAGLLAPLVYTGALWAVGGIGAEERALVRRIAGRG
jgi:O-antigen/teichoic acid export membrane protein